MAASRGFRHVACWLLGLAVSCCFLMPLPAGHADDYEVDLALVLAIDCSFSVDSLGSCRAEDCVWTIRSDPSCLLCALAALR